jgi:DNA gyrase subunit A
MTAKRANIVTGSSALPQEHSIVSIEEEMRRSYLDYAMSVIVSRAIPDVRDGLKPVHRRILYAMYESGCLYNRPYRKSARIVGEVMGKFHPHGDSAIYDALVRMAQDFSLRLPLIDGQGNFGSMDGDAPAAMRYTESRLDLAAHKLLEDLDKDTVDFQPNYDGSEQEPKVLPAQYPNLLVNGAGGIAVGMATNIPPHNLGEVIDACCAYIDDPEITPEALMEIVPGPDFPTGGVILGKSGIYSAIQTGRGSILIRGKTEIEEHASGKATIVISEVPYQVNKAKLVERIAELVREKKIEGIAADGLRDESDRNGVRVVVEVRRDANADIILNQLYSFTPLQTSFGVNMLALNRGRPEQLSLKDVLRTFVDFREEVITRRTTNLLQKARDRAHLLVGLAIAVANIDEVIALIRAAMDPSEAKESLMARAWPASAIAPLVALVDPENPLQGDQCHLSEAQAKAILEMRLHRLTGLEHQKITSDLEEIVEEIKRYLEILGSRMVLIALLRQELLAIKEQFATPRRTVIDTSEFEQDMEDLIPKEEMVVTVTMGGYIKRVPLATYRAQRRGGKGRSGMAMRDEDITTEVLVTNTHTPVLFFSTTGKVYRLKVYKLPLGTPQSKGRALVNIFPMGEGETINNIMPLPEDQTTWEAWNVVFATASGNIRRNSLADFRIVQANGKIAMKLDAGDALIGVQLCTHEDHVLLSTRQGKSIRFPVDDLRVFKSRDSDGVRGIRLADEDKVMSLSILSGAEASAEDRDHYLKLSVEVRQQLVEENPPHIESTLSQEQLLDMAAKEQFILTVTENGFGKRSSAYEYRITNRGGSGVINIITSERNGAVVASFPVQHTDDIMLLTNKGKLIRCPVHDIRIIGRNTQGVSLLKTAEEEVVMSAVRIPDSGESTEEELEEGVMEQAAEGAVEESATEEPINE